MKQITIPNLFKRAVICFSTLIICIITYVSLWDSDFVNQKNFGVLVEITPSYLILFLLFSLLFGMYAIRKKILYEQGVYKSQIKNGFIKQGDLQNKGKSLLFIACFLSFGGTIFTGSIAMTIIGLNPKFVFLDHGIIQIIRLILCLLGLFVPMMVFGSGVTSYRVVSIPLSEYEICGSGSKNFDFKVEVMIYGDVNSNENLTIINGNIKNQLPGLKKQIEEDRDKKEKQERTHLLTVEGLFTNNKWYKFKENLTALKI